MGLFFCNPMVSSYGKEAVTGRETTYTQVCKVNERQSWFMWQCMTEYSKREALDGNAIFTFLGLFEMKDSGWTGDSLDTSLPDTITVSPHIIHHSILWHLLHSSISLNTQLANAKCYGGKFNFFSASNSFLNKWVCGWTFRYLSSSPLGQFNSFLYTCSLSVMYLQECTVSQIYV